NVLLDADGRAKVTDFGIAHAVDVDGMTITGTIMGTSNYIAPEQARGQPVDEQTDVYSLGCVLYELLAGEVPFDGDSFVAIAMRHVNDPVPSVREVRPDVPPRLDWAIQRAMAKDHGDRFESMADFAAELEACHEELDGGEGATMVVPRAAAPRRRRQRPRRRRRLPLSNDQGRRTEDDQRIDDVSAERRRPLVRGLDHGSRPQRPGARERGSGAVRRA